MLKLYWILDLRKTKCWLSKVEEDIQNALQNQLKNLSLFKLFCMIQQKC